MEINLGSKHAFRPLCDYLRRNTPIKQPIYIFSFWNMNECFTSSHLLQNAFFYMDKAGTFTVTCNVVVTLLQINHRGYFFRLSDWNCGPKVCMLPCIWKIIKLCQTHLNQYYNPYTAVIFLETQGAISYLLNTRISYFMPRGLREDQPMQSTKQ